MQYLTHSRAGVLTRNDLPELKSRKRLPKKVEEKCKKKSAQALGIKANQARRSALAVYVPILPAFPPYCK